MLEVGKSAGEAGRGTENGGDAVCRVAGLRKTYRTGFLGRRVDALRDVTFAVGRGEICGLLGHNGAGKTTTLKAILDLVRPDAGTIELLGRDHHDRRARARVGYLPENPYFYDYLTAHELLDLYARLSDVPARERRRRADTALAMAGLDAPRGVPLRKFSKGMLQRVGLAQALLHDPELLILDEPMSGLDPLGRKEVRDLLGDLRARGRTILLSSHIVPDLEALADSVVILARGRLAGRHALRDAGAPRTEVWVDRRPADPAFTALCRDCVSRPAGGGRRGEIITVPDLPRLRLLLELCATAEIAVREVTSRPTGLEELFLRSLGRAEDEPARRDLAGAEAARTPAAADPARGGPAPDGAPARPVEPADAWTEAPALAAAVPAAPRLRLQPRPRAEASVAAPEAPEEELVAGGRDAGGRA
jgi:ABC-2 type transport system ATP-binding protein